jgi:DNA mismatch repair ATPase MutS
MFRLVEARRFEGATLGALQRELVGGREAPSRRMRRFERIIEALAVRHSALMYAVVSIGIHWEIFQCARLERWRATHGKTLRRDLEILADFEALASVGAFAADHPPYAWPSVRLDGVDPVLSGRGLGHPLFDHETRRTNDFVVPSAGRLVLITGSNMSGKSSFLRTVGVNTRLALAGAPVCADALEMLPTVLATSIQVTDAPAEGMSRFYAEVKRIAGVVTRAERAQEGGPHVLYLVDEMLSGTNSRERHLACRAVVQRLVDAPRSFGLVTTHDLELVGVVDSLPEQVECMHFSDRFDGERLHFDYALKAGTATTTNALHVMRMEGLDVEAAD